MIDGHRSRPCAAQVHPRSLTCRAMASVFDAILEAAAQLHLRSPPSYSRSTYIAQQEHPFKAACVGIALSF